MVKSIKCSFMLLIVFLNASIWAYDYSGTVYNSVDMPLEGIEVSYVTSGLSRFFVDKDTTDVNGEWGVASVSTPNINFERLSTFISDWDGQELSFELNERSEISIEVFNTKGRLLESLPAKFYERGAHKLQISTGENKYSKSWVRLILNDDTYVAGSIKQRDLKNKANPKTLSLAPIITRHSIEYRYRGELIHSENIWSDSLEGIKTCFNEIDISGIIQKDDKVDLNSLRIQVEDLVRYRKYDYNINYDGDDKYDDKVLIFTDSLKPQVTYIVWVNAMGNGGKLVGQSNKITVESNQVEVGEIPVFNVANRIPQGVVSGSEIGLVNTEKEYVFELQSIEDDALYYEWNLDNGMGYIDGLANIYASWSSVGTYDLKLRITDIDGNVVQFSKSVVVFDSPVYSDSLMGFSILKEDTMKLSLDLQGDGVDKVYWDYGDGFTDSTFNDDIHSINHLYPQDVVEEKKYTLTITYFDSTGGQSTKSSEVTVRPNTAPEILSIIKPATLKIYRDYYFKIDKVIDVDNNLIDSAYWDNEGTGFFDSVTYIGDSILFKPVQFGTHSINVRVKDEVGAWDTLSFDVNVQSTSAMGDLWEAGYGSQVSTGGYWYGFDDKKDGGSSTWNCGGLPGVGEKDFQKCLENDYIDTELNVTAEISEEGASYGFAGVGFNLGEQFGDEKEMIDLSVYNGVSVEYKTSQNVSLQLIFDENKVGSDFHSKTLRPNSNSVQIKWSDFKQQGWGTLTDLKVDALTEIRFGAFSSQNLGLTNLEIYKVSLW